MCYDVSRGENMYTLQNKKLKVTINPFGAELVSVVDINSGFEFMYDANPNFWKRHAPNLFPIVGRLKDNSYFYQGKEYKMSQHGFARDSMFELIEESNDTLIFSLSDNEESLKIYPFHFNFIIVYKLEDDHINITYRVNNPSKSELLFSVGAHPGFSFDESQVIDDYKISISPSIENKQFVLDGASVNPVPSIKEERLSSFPISMQTFKNDALIYSDDIDSITMESTKSNHKVIVDMKGFPYVGIWTTDNKKEKSPFLCIEPWHGIADFTDHDKNLETKRGINKLGSNETFESTYTITFKK
jgi:galactose mutarotase-like enzyme